MTGHTGAGWQIVRLYGTAEALLRSRITSLWRTKRSKASAVVKGEFTTPQHRAIEQPATLERVGELNIGLALRANPTPAVKPQIMWRAAQPNNAVQTDAGTLTAGVTLNLDGEYAILDAMEDGTVAEDYVLK